jgi:hypothetical protein
MAHVRTVSGKDDNGFDASRSLLVLSTNSTTSLYLVEGGSDELTVVIDDPEIASFAEQDETQKHKKDIRFTEWERSQAVHKLSIKGRKAGKATLRAVLAGGQDFIAPVTIRVVDNSDYRQAEDQAAITPELRQELQKLDVRAAVLRVAEDQMYSKIGRTLHGGSGRYGLKSGVDWCGAFAHWCWATASEAKGLSNPFSASNNVLLSPQKAISWALQSGKATILRYQGGDPYGWNFTTGRRLGKEAKTQKFVEINPSNPLSPADIVLVRDETTWRHVALVWSDPCGGDVLDSIDGNQGQPSIQRKSRNMKKKVNSGTNYALVFLHVDV